MQNNTIPNERLLAKLEAAKYLNISVRTLDLWISQRKVPYIKLGSTRGSLVRFKKSDLETMVAQLTVSSI